MLRKILILPTDQLLIQLIRYGFVVCIAFPIDFGLLYFFTSKLHINYILSATLAFSISMVVNFLISIAWVFTDRTSRALWKELTMFSIVGFVGLVITDLLMWTFTSGLKFHYLESKLIAICIVFFWSFFARRYMFQNMANNPS